MATYNNNKTKLKKDKKVKGSKQIKKEKKKGTYKDKKKGKVVTKSKSKEELKVIEKRREEIKRKELIELHERQQRLSRRHSPNIKTRTTATKKRWKGWRYYEEPSEVITYTIAELQANLDKE